jgi:MFS superfamily sulfate permease-like transporter
VHSLPPSKVVTAVRFDGRLYFANVAYFEDAILEAVAANPEARALLVVGEGINEIDASGEEVMHHVVQHLRDAGIEVAFSGPEEAGGRRHARHRAAGFHRRGAAVSHGGCGTGCDPRRGGGAR